MAGKLGIIAGGGPLPARAVETCRHAGRPVFVLALEGHTAPETVRDVEHVWIRLGAAGSAIDLLHAAEVEELVLVGPIKRPSIAQLRPDLRTMHLLAKIGANALGDDGLLRAIIAVLEGEGFRVVGIDDLLSEMVVPEGRLGQHAPDDDAESDIRRGFAVAKTLGAADVGQAVVVQQGLVLGVEAIEGTDALLARVATLRREGPGGVLVKVKKPGQEGRADLPTIGVTTVEQARAAGLRGIALESGGGLIVERAAVVRAADAAGLFLVGRALIE